MKATTLNSYLSVFEKWIKPEFEHRGMQSISSGDVNEFKAKLQNAGLQPKTVRNVLNLLNKFFTDGVKDCYLRHSPMEGVDLPSVSRKKKGRALKAGEVSALLDNCEDKKTELIVLTAITTGMRRGELFGLFWEHVNWDDSVIHVRQSLVWKYGKHIRPEKGKLYDFTTPKSETSIRDIPMSPHLKKELRALFLRSKKKGLVFHNGEKPLDPNGFVKRQFASALMAAELGKLRFHDLRHSYGSHKLDQGCNIYDVQRWMGHSSIQVTIDTYGHPVTDRGQEAAAKTDAFLFGLKAAD
jgi:integrase